MKCPKCGFISFDYLETCKHCNAKLGEVRKMVGPTGFRPAHRTVLLESTGAAALAGTVADFEFSEGGGEDVIEFGFEEAEDAEMSPVADFQESAPESSEDAQGLFDFASDDEDIQEIQLDLSEMEEELSFEPELNLGTTDESLGEMGDELDIPLEEMEDDREFSLTSEDLDLLSESSGAPSGEKNTGDSLFTIDDEADSAKEREAWALDDDEEVEPFILDESSFEKIEEEDNPAEPLVELSDDLSLDLELGMEAEAVAEVSGHGEGLDFSDLSMEKDEPEALKLEPAEAATGVASGPDDGIDFSGLDMEKDEPEELNLEPVEPVSGITAESDDGIDFSATSLEKDEPEELELEPVDTVQEVASEPDEGIDFSAMSLEKEEPEELNLEPVEPVSEVASEPEDEVGFSGSDMEKEEPEELNLEPVENVSDITAESDDGIDFSSMSFEKDEPAELELEPIESSAEAAPEPEEGINLSELSAAEDVPDAIDVEPTGETAETVLQAAPEMETPEDFAFDAAGEDPAFSIDEPAETSDQAEPETKAGPMLDVDDLENGLNDMENEQSADSREAGPEQVFDISADLDESNELPDLSLEQLGEDEIFQSVREPKTPTQELQLEEEFQDEEPPVVSLDDDLDADLEELAKDFEAELKDIELEVAADLRMSDDEVMAAIPDEKGKPIKYEV